MNLDTVLQGLAITVVGMGLVFLALGLIVLAIILMGRFLRPRPTSKDKAPEPGAESEERAVVAAMVAAVILARTGGESHDSGAWDVARPSETTSSWQASHRAQALVRRP